MSINFLREAFSARKRKVFCIGYNKTGTTTLEKVLLDLGYRMPDQLVQEGTVVEELFRGNFEPLKKLCKQYDAFQDMPFSQEAYYAAVDSLFPNSLFILTLRDSDKWFESLTRFHLSGILKLAGIESLDDFDEQTLKGKMVHVRENYMYNCVKRQALDTSVLGQKYDWSLVYDRAYRIKAYEARNAEIIAYFQGRPSQLLVLDITKEQDTSKIVEFLGLPAQRVKAMPHLNSSESA